MTDVGIIVEQANLDSDQVRVATAAADERIYVTAGPGSGKTETVGARIEHLVHEEGLGGDEVVVISFSRAAVETVQRRQRRSATRTWVLVSTLDSLAGRMLAEADEDTIGKTFDQRIRCLLELLRTGSLKDPWPNVLHVIVDEAQDIVGDRALLVEELLRTLPQSAGFTMLADPRQAIYDFQLNGASISDPPPMLRSARDLGATEVALQGQYRARTEDALRAMLLRGKSMSDHQWTLSMRDYLADMPVLRAEELAPAVERLTGSVAVLTRSNPQSIVTARLLHEHGVAADLLPRSTDRSIDPWVAEVLCRVSDNLDRGSFAALAADRAPMDPDEAWALLRGSTRARTRSLDVRELVARLASGVVPTALVRPPGRITVSTIHRAKGLEFDHVVMLHPDEWVDEDDSARARTMYVGITRPRHRLFTYKLDKLARGWVTDQGGGRARRRPWNGKGTTGFEVRGTDWRGALPPGEDQERTQELLRSVARAERPLNVTVRSLPSGTPGGPKYNALYEGDVVATLGDQFIANLTRVLGRQSRWPQLSELFLVGAETVVGPQQDGPVGGNGLWLSPLIVGAADLGWESVHESHR